MYISKHISRTVAHKVINSMHRTSPDKCLSFRDGRLIVFNCSHAYGQQLGRLILCLESAFNSRRPESK